MILHAMPVHLPLSRGCADVCTASSVASVDARQQQRPAAPRLGGEPCKHGVVAAPRSWPTSWHAEAANRRRSSVLCASSTKGGGLPAREAAERRRLLLKYVREVQPALVEQFVEIGPPAVVAAMKNTITNMLGTLPPQFFTVTVSTVGENMSQLMLSVMMTGYLFRNAQYRLELRSALGGAPVRSSSSSSSSSSVVSQAAAGPVVSQHINATGVLQRSQSAPAQGSVLDEEAYAPGVQKSRVQGDVLLWHKENGLETLEAVQYIELLEGEVARLRQQLTIVETQPQGAGQQQHQQQPPLQQQQQGSGGVAQQDGRQLPVPVHSSSSLQQAANSSSSSMLAAHSSGPAGLLMLQEDSSNMLLEYLRGLDAASLADLTSSADSEVAQAMEAFVGRLMGTTDRDSLSRVGSDCTAQELAKVMLWLMIVGYTLRGLEVRWDMASAVLADRGSQGAEARLSCDNSHEAW